MTLTPRVAVAVAAELGFAAELRALDEWPSPIEPIIARYNEVDLECQRAGDEATPEEWRALSAAMRAVRAEERALGRRSVLTAACRGTEPLRLGCVSVSVAATGAHP